MGEIVRNTSLVEIAQIISEMINSEEETPNKDDLIRQLVSAQKDKVRSFSGYLKHLDYLEQEAKAETKSLDAYKKRLKRTREHLEYCVGRACDELMTKRLEGSNGHFLALDVRDNIDIFDESQIPDEFVTVETIKKVRAEDVKKAILSGREIPGARLKKNINLKY